MLCPADTGAGASRRGPSTGPRFRPAHRARLTSSNPVARQVGKDARMNGPDGPRQEIATLRERISRLNAATLRISASRDLDTVLQEVVDSARATRRNR